MPAAIKPRLRILFGADIALGPGKADLLDSVWCCRRPWRAWAPGRCFPIPGTRRAAGNLLAADFVRYMESEPARAVMRRYGFALPGEAGK